MNCSHTVFGIGEFSEGEIADFRAKFAASARDIESIKALLGRRFVLARELNGLGQLPAAQQLGYENGTQLSLIENGQRLPTIRAVLTAAAIYSVSADFLLGLSSSPEMDQRLAERHAVMRTVRHLVSGATETIAGIVADKLGPSVNMVDAWERMHSVVAEVISQYERVRTLNPDWFEAEVRAGSNLERAIEALRVSSADLGPSVRAQSDSILQTIARFRELSQLEARV